MLARSLGRCSSIIPCCLFSRSYGDENNSSGGASSGLRWQSSLAMNGGQERLDWLMRWCQWMDLSPFRMERDADTGRFSRFSFSWRSRLAIWWISIKAVNVITCFVYAVATWKSIGAYFVEESYTTTAILANQVVFVMTIANWLIAPEVMVLRCRQFSKASRYLGEFDRKLQALGRPRCSTRKWTLVGIVGIVSWV